MQSEGLQRPATRLSVDWGHLLTVMGMGAWALWYLVDLRKASLDIENTLLVQPLIIVFLLMLLGAVSQCLRKEAMPEALRPEPLDRSSFLKVASLMAAFAAMVWSMFAIGFDFGVFAFCAVTMVICGERRWWLIAVFSALTTVLLVKGYQLLVPFQMPNLLLN